MVSIQNEIRTRYEVAYFEARKGQDRVACQHTFGFSLLEGQMSRNTYKTRYTPEKRDWQEFRQIICAAAHTSRMPLPEHVRMPLSGLSKRYTPSSPLCQPSYPSTSQRLATPYSIAGTWQSPPLPRPSVQTEGRNGGIRADLSRVSGNMASDRLFF